MITTGDLQSVISRLHETLTKCGHPYHLTGGIVSSYYGEPRFTQDIDLVISIDARNSSLSSLIEALSVYFIVDEVAASKT